MQGGSKTTKIDGAEAEAAEIAGGQPRQRRSTELRQRPPVTLRASFTRERGRGAAGVGKSEGESQLAMTRKRERAVACAYQ